MDDGFIDELKALVDQYLKDEVAPYKRDKQGKIIKLFNLFDRNEKFKQLYTLPSIIKPLQSLLGPNIEFLKNRHNHVSVIQKGSNERRFHRDVLHWSRPVISVLIYLQDSDIYNGCTEIIPTSQYLPFVPPYGLPNHAGTWLDEFEVYKGFENQALPVPVRKGDVLIFDTLIFHSPGINLTDEPRYAITAAYHAVDELLPTKCNHHRILVSGKRTYCGNELNWE